MTILDQLADYSRERLARDKQEISEAEIKRTALSLEKGDFAFEKALKQKDLAIIAEVKKASPSKGVIDESFDYMEIARAYEEAGVDAVSCLTEPKWFLGSDTIFKEIRQAIQKPMLRKDFTVDPYQIYQAKVMGADAVLIICSLLDNDLALLKDYLALCQELGLSALVETHDKGEIDLALEAGARIIGVNNRNLKDFSVNFDNASNLRQAVPEDIIFVAESGVQTASDIQEIVQTGADAVLVGEALMRSDDKSAQLAAFRKAGKRDEA